MAQAYVYEDGKWLPLGEGGGGGTTNYNNLTNKPKINGVELAGNQTPSQLGIIIPQASGSNPLMDGTASAGTSESWSKGDHRHPTDTSREAAGKMTIGGTVYTVSKHTLSWTDNGVTHTYEVLTV